MRTFDFRNRVLVASLLVAVAVTSGACEQAKPTGPTTLAIANATDLPPVYTPQQCADLVSQFPGWSSVASVPEQDANGVPTIFYAAIAVSDPIQIDVLKAANVYVDSMPIFMDQTTRAKFDGKTGYMSKSTCGGAEIVWALMPGMVFNRLAQDTVKFNEPFIPAIVFLPLPDSLTDTSITYNGALHPLSLTALRNAGFNVPQAPSAPSAEPTQAASATPEVIALSLNPFHYVKEGLDDLGSLLDTGAKDVVNGAIDVGHTFVGLWTDVTGWAACEKDGCVNVKVHLDVRNTDAKFGGQALAGGNDGTTPIVRAWGSGANNPIQLTGVTVTVRENEDWLGPISGGVEYSGTVQSNGVATIQALKGKSSDFCITLDNYAATLNDWFNARELCDFSQILTTANGNARPTTTFSADDEVWLRVQDKYVNVMAQLTDGYDYLQQVVGYTPRKVKALSGTPLTLPPVKQLISARAVTPCLNFPDIAVDALNDILDSAGTALAGPLGYIFAGTVESIYEDDMWLPDLNDTLTSRGIASHEYGHFAMCSLLYDEDPTKMVQIPSLTIQRALEGESVTATSEVAYIMEGWADFFAGQLASGASYFSMENEIGRDGSMSYCRGDSTNGPCWDWNYVEDFNSASDGGPDSIGFDNQVRRVATTLFDAFDGQHPKPPAQPASAPSASGTPTFTGLGGLFNGVLRPVANAVAAAVPMSISWPGEGDFWTESAATLTVPSSVHNGDAKDEVIALPGSGLRTLIHNWTHNASALDWRVTQQQFFAALNATIRSTPAVESPSRDYNWCEVCQMFAQHDGLSCSITGNTSEGGLCLAAGGATEPSMSVQQMVTVCEQSPTIPGFIGAPPSGSDPTSPCSFTGCPAHTILVGDVGDTVASCDACGPHQVSTGTHACGADVCATPNLSGTTCVDCADDQIVGGGDKNTCVSCPPLQIPSADRTTCVPCGPHQIASGVSCVDCQNNQVAMPDNTCQACPDGQMPYSPGVVGPEATYGESCLPVSDCTCGSSFCRTVNSNGLCVDTIG